MSESAVIKRVYENPGQRGKTNVKALLDQGADIYINNAVAADFPVGSLITFTRDKAVGKGHVVTVHDVKAPVPAASQPSASTSGDNTALEQRQAAVRAEQMAQIRGYAAGRALNYVTALLTAGCIKLPADVAKRVDVVDAIMWSYAEQFERHALTGEHIAAPTAKPAGATASEGSDSFDDIP